jgi:hypothetical protein
MARAGTYGRHWLQLRGGGAPAFRAGWPEPVPGRDLGDGVGNLQEGLLMRLAGVCDHGLHVLGNRAELRFEVREKIGYLPLDLLHARIVCPLYILEQDIADNFDLRADALILTACAGLIEHFRLPRNTLMKKQINNIDARRSRLLQHLG